MSKPVIQFVELVRESYASLQSAEGRKYFCANCGKETAHVFLGEQGIYERYQCLVSVCGCIRSVAVI